MLSVILITQWEVCYKNKKSNKYVSGLKIIRISILFLMKFTQTLAEANKQWHRWDTPQNIQIFIQWEGLQKTVEFADLNLVFLFHVMKMLRKVWMNGKVLFLITNIRFLFSTKCYWKATMAKTFITKEDKF